MTGLIAGKAAPRVARLGDLRPETAFRVLGMTGTLERKTSCAATVRLDRTDRRRFTARGVDGDREVEIAGGSTRTTWSLGTLVEVLS